MSLEQVPGVFVQRLSIWKTLAVELVLIAGAVLPLIPTFSDGLVYTAIFYRTPFHIVLVTACTVFALMALIYLFLLWRAVLGVPVLTITDKTITTNGRKPRTVDIADVESLVRLWPAGGNINLQIRGQRPLPIPAYLMTNPQQTVEELEKLVRAVS